MNTSAGEKSQKAKEEHGAASQTITEDKAEVSLPQTFVVQGVRARWRDLRESLTCKVRLCSFMTLNKSFSISCLHI